MGSFEHIPSKQMPIQRVKNQKMTYTDVVNVFKDSHNETIVTINDSRQMYAQSEIVKIKAVD